MPANGPVASYSPDRCTIALGAAVASGFAPGTFVRVERTNPDFVVREGSDGEIARAERVAKVGTMTLTLMSTSLFNAVLRAYAAAKQIFPVLIKEGNTVVFGAQAWVEMQAPFERGDEVTDTEWVLTIAHVDLGHGGNS